MHKELNRARQLLPIRANQTWQASVLHCQSPCYHHHLYLHCCSSRPQHHVAGVLHSHCCHASHAASAQQAATAAPAADSHMSRTVGAGGPQASPMYQCFSFDPCVASHNGSNGQSLGYQHPFLLHYKTSFGGRVQQRQSPDPSGSGLCGECLTTSF